MNGLIYDLTGYLYLRVTVVEHRPGVIFKKAKQTLFEHADALAVSSISLFEIGIKVQRKKLQLPLKTADWFSEMSRLYNLIDLSLTADIASLASELPDIHRDPFDRIIIATAIARRIPLVTADGIIPQYPDITVIW